MDELRPEDAPEGAPSVHETERDLEGEVLAAAAPVAPAPAAEEPPAAEAPPAPPAPEPVDATPGMQEADLPGDAAEAEPVAEEAGAATAEVAAVGEQEAPVEEPSADAPPFATADVVPAPPRRRRRILVAAAALLGVLSLGAAGVAYATYDYDRDHAGRILPGASIAGVDVGGMDRDDAIAAVKEAVAPQLTREVTLTYAGKTWTVTPEQLGARSDARAAVDAALAASEDVTFLGKARMRVLGEALDFERDVAVRYPRKGIKGFVAGIASSFDREARDASLDYSTGWVEIVDDRRGRKVRLAPTVAALTDALESGTDRAELVVDRVDPEVTTDAFRQVLLVHIGDNKLYLYEDGEIVREWTVATGEPAYMTPTGLFHVTEKRYMPTWVNPSPDGWGASMPASIPPGPGNPLGVRAINWSAPAIRFHGTSALYSLGYNASHGCVRMSNADVIELYDIVEVGTPIVSIVHGPLRPLGSSAPSGPTAEQSADSTGDARAAETEAAGA